MSLPRTAALLVKRQIPQESQTKINEFTSWSTRTCYFNKEAKWGKETKICSLNYDTVNHNDQISFPFKNELSISRFFFFSSRGNSLKNFKIDILFEKQERLK